MKNLHKNLMINLVNLLVNKNKDDTLEFENVKEDVICTGFK